MDGCTHHGGVELRHADARTACDARNSVANGAACVPACVSLPVVDTKNPRVAVGGRGSGGAGRGLGRGGAPAQLLSRKPSCLTTDREASFTMSAPRIVFALLAGSKKTAHATCIALLPVATTWLPPYNATVLTTREEPNSKARVFSAQSRSGEEASPDVPRTARIMATTTSCTVTLSPCIASGLQCRHGCVPWVGQLVGEKGTMYNRRAAGRRVRRRPLYICQWHIICAYLVLPYFTVWAPRARPRRPRRPPPARATSVSTAPGTAVAIILLKRLSASWCCRLATAS